MLCPPSYALDAIWILLEESNQRTVERDLAHLNLEGEKRVKWPSPITALEGVIKIEIAGRFLI